MRLITRHEKSGIRRVSLFLFRKLGALGLLAGIVSLALHFVGTTNEVLVIGTSLVPFGILAAVIGAGLFALGRSPRMGAVAVLVTLAAAATQLPLYWSADAENGTHVTVMQANILFDGADAKTVVELVRSNDVDILTVNELTPEAVASLAEAGLDELLPHDFVQPAEYAHGTGIYSRFALTDTKPEPGFILTNLSAVADVPGVGDVSIFALHPVPPPISAANWSNELDLVRDLLAQSAGPAIVGADFNATWDHKQFRALLGRFGDAAEQAGAGHLMTYPTDKWGVPIVGIDHILTAGGTATDVRIADLPGSDHRALVATVVLH